MEKITVNELSQMGANMFGNLVKAVVDVDREFIAVDAELHSDLEALFLEDGSKQKNLWGINLYFFGKDEYRSNEAGWRKYFSHFTYAARKNY